MQLCVLGCLVKNETGAQEMSSFSAVLGSNCMGTGEGGEAVDQGMAPLCAAHTQEPSAAALQGPGSGRLWFYRVTVL